MLTNFVTTHIYIFVNHKENTYVLSQQLLPLLLLLQLQFVLFTSDVWVGLSVKCFSCASSSAILRKYAILVCSTTSKPELSILRSISICFNYDSCIVTSKYQGYTEQQRINIIQLNMNSCSNWRPNINNFQKQQQQLHKCQSPVTIMLKFTTKWIKKFKQRKFGRSNSHDNFYPSYTPSIVFTV